jgi:hypothetical protein
MSRTLREYEHVAQMEHSCSICGYNIRPGDLYRGIVSLVRGEFSIWKEHVHPFCPEEFFDEEAEIHRRAVEDSEKEKSREASEQEERKAA